MASRLPSSRMRPGPAARIVPSWGFSFAVSGRTMALLVIFSRAGGWITTARESGRHFLAARGMNHDAVAERAKLRGGCGGGGQRAFLLVTWVGFPVCLVVDPGRRHAAMGAASASRDDVVGAPRRSLGRSVGPHSDPSRIAGPASLALSMREC